MNNYHTHTFRCNHASGCDEDYVISAIRAGIQELGFSDHSPWDYSPSTFKGSHIRMRLSEFDEYYNSISNLKIKYKDQISIKIGLEVEYFPSYMNWLKQFIIDKQLDYIILGNHFYLSDENGPYYGRDCVKDEVLIQYGKDSITALETGLYAYLAHPDLFMRGRAYFDKLAEQVSIEICEACKRLEIPLEYNLAGVEANKLSHKTQYPHPKFWEIAAKVGNKAIIGFDAHSNKQLERTYLYLQGKEYLEKLGIEVVDSIKFLK